MIEDQHLQLIKNLKNQVLFVQQILDLSLVVQIIDIPRYIEDARMFVSRPAGQLVLESIHKKPN